MAGDHRAAYKNKVAGTSHKGGLLSAWVYRPNHIPALQAYFQVGCMFVLLMYFLAKVLCSNILKLLEMLCVSLFLRLGANVYDVFCENREVHKFVYFF